MASNSAMILLLLVATSAFALEERDADLENSDKIRNLWRRGLLDCKQDSESCNGFPQCCGTLQCFWKNGYSVKQSGVCVTCVDKDQKCQRNEQCCDRLVCQKEDMISVDGTCDEQRPVGGNCYRDSQCQTNNCEITWNQRLMKESGKCANNNVTARA